MQIVEKSKTDTEIICDLEYGKSEFFPIDREKSIRTLASSKQPGRNTAKNKFPDRTYKVTIETITKDGLDIPAIMVTRTK